jgi:hypothetical protein
VGGICLYALYPPSNIVDNSGKSAKDFSSKLDPNYAVTLFSSALSLEAEKLTGEDWQEFELRVPAYGARVVALDMTEKEREKLDKDAAVSISTENGEELVLLKSLSKETKTSREQAFPPGVSENP